MSLLHKPPMPKKKQLLAKKKAPNLFFGGGGSLFIEAFRRLVFYCLVFVVKEWRQQHIW